MTKHLPAIIPWAESVLWSQALVQVNFSHSYFSAAGSNQSTGEIKLAFASDSSGNVVLNPSCVETTHAAHVNDFDDPAGTTKP